jgi:hypothetical protein
METLSYPNIVIHNGLLAIHGVDEMISQLTIHDLTGKLCYAERNIPIGQDIILPKMNNGLYLIKLQIGSKIITRKKILTGM